MMTKLLHGDGMLVGQDTLLHRRKDSLILLILILLGPMVSFLMLRKLGEHFPILPRSSSGRIFLGVYLTAITWSSRL
jgi:hypothetical protein